MSCISSKDSTPLANMTEKIAYLEHALRQIADAKKQLYRNTSEAKSRIQSNISRQLETLRNREVWLLSQLDVVSSAKEEVLQQQSARLNKTLGVLQSSIHIPDNSGDNTVSRNLARLDLGELQPEETPYVSFKSEPRVLRDTIMNYGRIDHTSVPPLHSPFMTPGQQAPSLPKQFEDYDDAEHHILYKTVEEINRNKGNEPCVNVNIPKLSNRLEDWLLQPTSTSTANNTDPKFTFPKLSNNLSDWLRTPSSVMTTKPVATETDMRPLEKLEGMSTDASIKTWLHKIKQSPYEEEDEYDFVEEMSETQTQSSGVETIEDPGEYGVWLSCSTPIRQDGAEGFKFKFESGPMDQWLYKPSKKPIVEEEKPVMIDMNRYLKNVKDELDEWLLASRRRTSDQDQGDDVVNERLRPEVPSTLPVTGWLLPSQFSSPVTKADNPWLQSSPIKSSKSFSSSSRNSSFSSFSSSRFLNPNKWLINGGQSEISTTVTLPCSFMEKYKDESEKLCWVKGESKMPNASPQSNNPLDRYVKEGFDPKQWLKTPTSLPAQFKITPSPLKAVIDFQKANSTNSMWLLGNSSSTLESSPRPDKAFDKSQNILFWLQRPGSPTKSDDLMEEDLC